MRNTTHTFAQLSKNVIMAELLDIEGYTQNRMLVLGYTNLIDLHDKIKNMHMLGVTSILMYLCPHKWSAQRLHELTSMGQQGTNLIWYAAHPHTTPELDQAWLYIRDIQP